MNTPADPVALAREVIGACLGEHGFALAGVCEARPSERADEYRAWLDAGRQGSMEWLGEHLGTRLDVTRFLPGARSVVMVADRYAAREGADERPRPGFGRIARYARGRDYHRIIKKRLHRLCDSLRERFPAEGFAAFTDIEPVMEREHAARAGIGWVGKHTLILHPKQGSWLLLGGLATTLRLEAPPEQRVVEDHCGSCTRCIDACPTAAITAWSVDASRCISELTIERRGEVPAEHHRVMGDWIFGCDVCQEVCPHNSPRPGAEGRDAVRSEYASRRRGFDLLEVLGWDHAARREAFRVSPMKRARLEMMQRNAVIAAGNSLEHHEDPALRARVEGLAREGNAHELVRRTAREALERLPGGRRG